MIRHFAPFLPMLLLAACSSQDSENTEDASPTDAADTSDSTDAEVSEGSAFDMPLQPGSPWPKFRRDAKQTARADFSPEVESGVFWSIPTGKGIFSSPVIGADGTIFVGSANRKFYALNADGSEKWSFATGEIIDSAALLDDRGNVYFGSGDGHLYALNAETGELVWDFEADSPAENSAFINWFEGNVAIGPDGTLYVPNDNWFVYAINRDNGEVKWRFKVPDQTWSLPAVDPETGNIFFGNNNLLELLGKNTFSLTADGQSRWQQGSDGSIAASALLASGRMIVGGFDGYIRAHDMQTGEKQWEFGARDHIYASAAELADGTVVVPSADGSLYALNPETGEQRWAFDIRESIRSSPAVDGNGDVYFGAGDGRLYVVNSEGQLRWSMQLIADDRNDLNASPALGRNAIYIAGESGEIFSVPYDYCLRPELADDSRCDIGPGENLPADGAVLVYTTELGSLLDAPPESIDLNRPIAFSLFVRTDSDNALALIDGESLVVETNPPSEVELRVSADRRFFSIRPLPEFVANDVGETEVRITGNYLLRPERDGLLMTGGEVGGTIDQTFRFAFEPGTLTVPPLTAPEAPGEAGGAWELYRLAAPNPTLLPSYNQIGFDSLHYLVGLVEGDATSATAWVVGAKLDDAGNTVIDPETRAVFPLNVTWNNGLVTMENSDGLGLEVLSARLAFDSFRIQARLDETGLATAPARLLVTALCADIPLYGTFLRVLGLCNPQSDLLSVYGAALLRPAEPIIPAGDVGEITLELTPEKAIATFSGSTLNADEHVFGLLLLDAAGKPVSLDYGLQTEKFAGAGGVIDRVELTLPEGISTEGLRSRVMVDLVAY